MTEGEHRFDVHQIVCSIGHRILRALTHLGDCLEERFAGGYKPGRLGAGDMRINLWYCPSCGTPTDGEMRCPDCARSLRDFLYDLVELHPHTDGKGGWR